MGAQHGSDFGGAAGVADFELFRGGFAAGFFFQFDAAAFDGQVEVIAACADAVGLPGAELVAAAGEEKIAALYLENRAKALAADVFGAPSYVLDGEVFWGQDRIDLLDDALTSGRAPYQPDVA